MNDLHLAVSTKTSTSDNSRQNMTYHSSVALFRIHTAVSYTRSTDQINRRDIHV